MSCRAGGYPPLELIVDRSKNVLRGGPGRDFLSGEDGDDVLYGEEGDDEMLWGGGARTSSTAGMATFISMALMVGIGIGSIAVKAGTDTSPTRPTTRIGQLRGELERGPTCHVHILGRDRHPWVRPISVLVLERAPRSPRAKKDRAPARDTWPGRRSYVMAARGGSRLGVLRHTQLAIGDPTGCCADVGE
jgi:RTX calcium-binding nonapeptide repeat (4 copies)